MPRPLVIDEDARQRADQVRKAAFARPYSAVELLAFDRFSKLQHTFNLHRGFRVVYTLEEQPAGWCHHAAVSVSSESDIPSVEAVATILDLLQLPRLPKAVRIWKNDFPGRPSEINVLFKVEDGFVVRARNEGKEKDQVSGS